VPAGTSLTPSGPFTTKALTVRSSKTSRSAGGTITAERDGWVAYVRLEDPPGISPITTVGRFDTGEAAQVATDEVWAAR
jgi:hypothetical protein